MNQLLDMLQMQQTLNDATGGKNWIEGFTNKGKPINWYRCIYMEAAELVDSYPWKHWKNIDAQPNRENIKIEIVDIWHFVMSAALRDYQLYQKGSLSDLAKQMSNLPHYPTIVTPSGNLPETFYDEIEIIENLIGVLFRSDKVLDLVDAFYDMSAKLGLSLTELYLLYLGKNVLNQFRQDHGYKEGTYVKNWNGEEDNVRMQHLLSEYPSVDAHQLYNLLEQAYQSIQKK